MSLIHLWLEYVSGKSLVRGMPGYSLNMKTMFHETINNSLIIQIFSSQVFNLNSGPHLIEATPIANEAFPADPCT